MRNEKFYTLDGILNNIWFMLEAAKLGWIDGIMMSYNYRLMAKDEMKRAVEACSNAGIGLTAMKTQASFSASFYASIGSETDDGMKMTENFLKKDTPPNRQNLRWCGKILILPASALPCRI